MKNLFLAGALLLATSTLQADDKPSTPLAANTQITGALATKAEWAEGLKEPQGLAHYNTKEILVAEYGSGKVLRYARDGKLLGTLAEGLKSPSQIVVSGNKVLVSERKANRIIALDKSGKITQLGEAIEEPMGLAKNASGDLFAVAHTTSKIYRFDGKKWNLVFSAPLEDGDDKRYGYRCLAYDGAFLLSDEVTEQVLLLTPGGRVAPWATGIADPSGITIGPDGATYVCDESAGGQLYRVSGTGEKHIVAQGLGRPRGVLFLDANTALVSDRDGTIWKLSFPKS